MWLSLSLFWPFEFEKKLTKKHAILQNISKLFYTMTLKDLVNSIGKVSDDWITDLEFNPYLH